MATITGANNTFFTNDDDDQRLPLIGAHRLKAADGSIIVGDNYVDETAEMYIVSGFRNSVGAGNYNVTIMDSSGCIVSPGLHHVTIMNSSGVTVNADRVTVIHCSGIIVNERDKIFINNQEFTSTGTFTNEQAQDAVGNILTDSSTIGFTYNDAGNTITAAVIAGGIDHNSLLNLISGDVHTQYVLSNGRAGGQTIIGGTAPSNNLILKANSHTTDGTITFYTDSTTIRATIAADGKFGIGVTPLQALHVDAGNFSLFDGSNAGTAISNLTGIQLENKNSTVNNWAGFGFADTVNGVQSAAVACQFTDRVNHFGDLAFGTRNASGFLERWRIEKGGSFSNTGSAGTAYIHLKAGTATANTAPIKLSSGVIMSVVEAGALEYDGLGIYYTTNTPARIRLIANSLGITGGTTLIGGTSPTDALEMRSTSGSGTTDHIKFTVGNNGAREAARIDNSGKIGIGETSMTYRLNIKETNSEANANQLWLRNINGGIGASGHSGIVFTALNSAFLGARIYHHWTGVNSLTDERLTLAVGNNSLLDVLTISNVLGFPKTGLGVITPSAVLELRAGANGTGQAPLKFNSGTNLLITENGTIEYNGTDFFATKTGGTRGTMLISTAATTEVVVTDTTLTITHNGVTYKLLAKA